MTPYSAIKPFVNGQLPFDGGYWLLSGIGYDGLRGWWLQIKPVLEDRNIDRGGVPEE